MAACNMTIERLIEVATHIRDVESKATTALYKDNNKDEYLICIREKAFLLSGLADEIAVLVQECSPAIRKYASDQIGQFAASADLAIELNSPFFMSALLYPESYQEGDKNDLENFILILENNCE